MREYIVAGAVVTTVAWTAHYLVPSAGHRAVAWIFLGVVVVMAVFVGRGATLLAAIVSALVWDYFFQQPLYSFYIASTEDRILFVMYLVIAVTLGQLVAQIRAQERAERERQERATALQLLTRDLSEAAGFDDMVERALRSVAEVFAAQVSLLLPSSSGALIPHPASMFQMSPEECAAASGAFAKPVRELSAEPEEAAILFAPLIHGGKAGVMALRFPKPRALTPEQQELLEAFSRQVAAVVQRFQIQEISEKAKLGAASELLSKTLLNSISHEIRTPLAVIQSAANNMLEFGPVELSPIQKSMLAEIQEATGRLDRLVGKVLDMTRLESGCVKPNFNLCEVGELVMMAEEQTRNDLAQHKLTIDLAPDLPPVPMDFELMLHALSNLLSNAAFHTPAGTEVWLTAKAETGALLLSVADQGPGIPPASLPRLFEKFYRAPAARTGGTGLGLSLVKGFVEAHGGQVTAENRGKGGAVFTIRFPLSRD